MNRDERHAAWVKANWHRWTHTGSYCDGARVNMDDVLAALAAYKAAVSGVDATAAPVRIMPPVRGLVDTHTEPEALRVISLYHHTMTDYGRKAA